MLNRRQFLRGAAAGSVAAPFIVRGAAAKAEFPLSLATVAPRGSSFHQSFQAMSQQWKEVSEGRVQITIYPQTQGGEDAIVRRMGINQLHGAMLTSAGMALIDPAANALQSMPMVFQSWEEVDHVRERMRPRLEAAFNQKGYEVIFWGDAGWVRWFTKKPVLRPADIKPMKIFASFGDQVSLEILKDYYRPVETEPDKIFTALTIGTIEGVPMPAFLANFTQVATVAKHMLDLKYAPVTGAFVVSRRHWEKIPEDLRAKLRAIGDKTGVEVQKNSRQEDDAAIVAMVEKQGLTVAKVTPEIEAEWRSVIGTAYPKIRGKLVPAPLFDEVMELLKSYRAQAKA